MFKASLSRDLTNIMLPQKKNALKECNAPFMDKVYNDPKSASKIVLNNKRGKIRKYFNSAATLFS
jgi:hypothetical protein